MTDKKIGEEQTEFIKDAEDPKKGYIFQNNKITKTGTMIIIGILVLLILGILVSKVFFAV